MSAQNDLMKKLYEEYNRAKHLQAIILRHRYWHDHRGQPRRNPTMQEAGG